MRFAFYGRVSTEDQQDPESSRHWQLDRSRQLVAPAGGVIVAEFFDVGQSRSLPWSRRPEAARLLTALSEPRRDFDAVVIGEPQRAFYGNQFSLTFPLFEHYGVGLYVPEVGGRIDPGSEAHDLVMNLFGGMSKGERSRIKTRVRAAMESQARHEGRFLGGRPPYGYQLVGAGPHPNPAKAADGKRLKQLAPDPETAAIAQRIFRERLEGRGIESIAERLNHDGIKSPSAHDPVRNAHRSGNGWSKAAVRAILRNPRYTGHQVWGRQRGREVLVDVDDVARGYQKKTGWTDASMWVWSEEPVHEALITREEFIRVQETFARTRVGASRSARRTARPYLLRGRLHCGACGRKMQGNWNHGRAHYRCRFPAEYAGMRDDAHRTTIYVREDEVVPAVDDWLVQLFDPEHIDETVEQLVSAAGPTAEETAQKEIARARVAECDARLRRYRALLDNGADPQLVAAWIADVQRERGAAERLLGEAPPQHLDADAIRSLIAEVGDIRDVLAAAAANDKTHLYEALGLSLTYRPEDHAVVVDVIPPCAYECVGEGT